jgi:hypothetical protein
MRVAVVNVTSLVTVRMTFGPLWRMAVAPWLLVVTLLVWAAITGSDPDSLPGSAGQWIGFLAFVVPALVVIFATFRRTGIYAQTLFTSIAASLLLLMLGWAFQAYPSGPSAPDAESDLIGVVALVFFFGYPVLESVRTLVPLRRWRAHRLRLALSRRLWSGEWRGATDPPEPVAAGEPHPRGRRLYLRFAWGWTALVLGLMCMALALAATANLPLAHALYNLDPGEVVHVLRTGPLDRRDELPPLHPGNLMLVAMGIAGFLGLRTFSAAWESWSRRNVPVRRSVMQMTASSILLLRPFREEERGVPGGLPTLRTFPRVADERAYTFVDLVVDRLSAVGPVKLFGWSENLPPPRSGVRYFTREWKAEICRVIPLARMIVVMFGATDSLAWELNEVRDAKALPKTVFLVPPDLNPLRARRRWHALAAALCPDPETRGVLTQAVWPHRVLAACVKDDLLLVLTGRRTRPAYESALDLATILALADPALTEGMVTKYVDPAARRFPWSRVLAGVPGRWPR